MSKNPKKPAFILKDVIDNWNDHPFSNGRYLDSLSGILAIQGPCAAVTFYNGKFFVSYNSSPTDPTQNILREVVPLLVQKSVKELLPYYLIFNTEFTKTIENYIDHNIEELRKCDPQLIKGLLRWIKSIEDYKNNLEKICYSNQELEEVYKTKPKAVLSDTALDTLRENINSKFEIISKVIHDKPRKFEEIFSQYIQFMNSVSVLIDDKDFKSILIRPLQDIEKACHYLKTLDDVQFEIIENPRKVHAEVNIAKEFPCIGKVYIGVSKLCCGACDETLDLYGYLHRGTHGVCFPEDWVAPAKQFDDTIEILLLSKQKDVLSKDPVLQKLTRQLSFDDFEKEIGNFYQLKTRLLLRGEKEASDFNSDDRSVRDANNNEPLSPPTNVAIDLDIASATQLTGDAVDNL